MFVLMPFSLSSCSNNNKNASNVVTDSCEQAENEQDEVDELLNSNGVLVNMDYKTLLQKASNINKNTNFLGLKEMFGIYPKYILETNMYYSYYYCNEYTVEIVGIRPIDSIKITNNKTDKIVYKVEF